MSRSIPCRFRFGQNKNILNLIFTNEEGMIETIEYLSGLGLNDHVCLNYELIAYTLEDRNEVPKFRFYELGQLHKNEQLP